MRCSWLIMDTAEREKEKREAMRSEDQPVLVSAIPTTVAMTIGPNIWGAIRDIILNYHSHTHMKPNSLTYYTENLTHIQHKWNLRHVHVKCSCTTGNPLTHKAGNSSWNGNYFSWEDFQSYAWQDFTSVWERFSCFCECLLVVWVNKFPVLCIRWMWESSVSYVCMDANLE